MSGHDLPPDDAPARRNATIAMVIAVLLGAAYIVWIAVVEGWRAWVVMGIIALIALFAAIAHRLMALTRR